VKRSRYTEEQIIAILNGESGFGFAREGPNARIQLSLSLPRRFFGKACKIPSLQPTPVPVDFLIRRRRVAARDCGRSHRSEFQPNRHDSMHLVFFSRKPVDFLSESMLDGGPLVYLDCDKSALKM
jgi:hypothetical protein